MNINIDGHTFDLAPETIEAVLDAMESTAKDGKEHGFLMCDTNEGVIPGERCTGNKCSIHPKDCKYEGPVVGSFHSHPTVISFSLSDYIHGIDRAGLHPENRHLLCVSLLNEGMRCKALKEIPSPEKQEGFGFGWLFDSEKNREKIKPFYTKRVNISVEQLNELLKGTPWEELPPAEPVIAIDEGEGPEVISGKKAAQIKKIIGEG